MRRIIYILFITMAVVATGCSSKKSDSSGSPTGYPPVGGYPPSNGGVPPITNPIESPTNTGSATDLVLTSQSALNTYAGWTTNNPTDVKIGVSLYQVSSYTNSSGGTDYSYGGLVSIHFKDGTRSYTDEFRSDTFGDGGCGQYDDCNTVSGNVKNQKYNLLSTTYPEKNGAPAYHGFFEDTQVRRLSPPTPYLPIFGGAVILVIDKFIDLGDGAGPSSASGSVWFKNYLGNYPMGPLPLTHCWFISSGPYDCRSWKNGDGVNTKKSLYPQNNYIKLGTFNNLN
ncbi:MAG: hypothetical protein KDD33_13970, partial [Bdellovibrionales bacterium]|nr:hypothetical protein [Bdellovibrionales bacterium]